MSSSVSTGDHPLTEKPVDSGYEIVKMAARILWSKWEKDEQLKSVLERYVLANYSRQMILDFASRDYPEYAWSLPTLIRRLNFLGITYIRYETSREDVKKAVQEEMEGPGQYLGYRAMQRKLRQQHKLAVPRNLAYDVMGMVDPEGLKRRGNVFFFSILLFFFGQ